MNRFMKEKGPWLEGTNGLRTQILDAINDAELAYRPGSTTMTLGELCREIGEIEYAYVQSLKTFEQDWSYHNTDEQLTSSVSALKTWFQALDNELTTIATAFSDEDLTKTVKRGEFMMPIELQLDIYIQAVLIFLGKATIYLKIMNKPLPPYIQEYIG